MPCYTVTKNTVDAGKLNPGLLIAALEAMKLHPRQTGELIRFGNGESYDTQTGKMQVVASRNVAEIKQAYSGQIVLQTAKKFGWTVKQTGYRYEVVKR